MEIRLNKDLQKMESRVALGLTFRQAVFGGLGITLGTLTYFISSKSGLNTELCGWFAMTVVLPLGALGFVRYHGLTFEQLVCVWLRYFFFCPRTLISKHENDLYNRDKEKIENAERKEAQRFD